MKDLYWLLTNKESGGQIEKMKEGIHPNYKETTITCVCGNVIETRSTKKDIKIEICSNCHPFITGKQKILDTAGRVEKFNKKYEARAENTAAAKKKTTKKASA
jgi:large subunit ribosomal protein L31